ncbi:MAG: hypothetical protein IPJ61_17610 [Tessaracoccus sp.]|uniref:hypothetical protein n=1 Tax=Tessaracoccus sp. TaxID=1971211 RepID=UPI001EB7A25B|nr:hypothetical protein [Tessaracoccus sp.]MBK7822822.1 hypothetical protein [Tessaracoccus sp.]
MGGWADPEAMVIAYLTEHLPERLTPDPFGPPMQVAFATAVPDPRPDRLVRVMLSGSERRTVVHRRSKITIEAWSDHGEADASALMEAVYNTLDAWQLVPPFDGWPSGPYQQTDPKTSTSRYIATCIVQHRAQE